MKNIVIIRDSIIETMQIKDTVERIEFKKYCRKINKSKKLKKFRHIVDYDNGIKVYGFLYGDKPNKHELIPKKDFVEGLYYGPLMIVRILNNALDNITKDEYLEYYDKIVDAITLHSEKRSTDGSDTEGSLKDFIVSDSDFT